MEHLTKQQVILLALLVAIVTSITTGIVTVSLADQSEGGVTQTIYRVVEKTIEKVTPADSPVRKIVEVPKPAVTTPSQVPLTEIVEKTSQAFIRIHKKNKNGEEKGEYVGLGLPVAGKGNIISFVENLTLFQSGTFVAYASDGTEMELSILKKPDNSQFAIFSLKDPANASKLKPIELKNFSSLKLGSNIIAFGGKEGNNTVSTGIVTEFQGENSGDTSNNIVLTDIALSSGQLGWVLLTTSGEICGFIVYDALSGNSRYKDATSVKATFGDLL